MPEQTKGNSQHSQPRSSIAADDPLGFIGQNMDDAGNFAPEQPPQNRDELERAQEEQLQLVRDYAATFSSDSGKRVLADLQAKTLGQATWQASLGLIHAIPHGFAREGQNAIVQHIVDMVAAGAEAVNLKEGK